MPEITVLIYTARDDFPYAGKAEGWHCFEPFLRTLADQTFKDFELVLVDALWEARSDWFADHPQPFPVKHVPSRPNYWQERGRPGLAAQINRGFIWADGRYVWMGGENNLFPSHHLALVSELCRSGKVPVAWYGMADRGLPGSPDTPQPCPEVTFDLQGFVRDDLCNMDHRAARFIGDPSLVISPCHNQHYYGYSSIPTEVAVVVNGFDELMDGRMALQDCDFGSRIAHAGCSLVMHRNLYVVEPPIRPTDGFGGGIRHQTAFQCNYAILLHNQLTNRRVNTRLPLGYVDDVRTRVCRGVCSVKDKCRDGSINESKQYPFCGGELESMALEWYAIAPEHDLAGERERRKRGESPYDRATIQGG